MAIQEQFDKRERLAHELYQLDCEIALGHDFPPEEGKRCMRCGKVVEDPAATRVEETPAAPQERGVLSDRI